MVVADEDSSNIAGVSRRHPFDGAAVRIKKKILRPVKVGRRAEEFFEFRERGQSS